MSKRAYKRPEPTHACIMPECTYKAAVEGTCCRACRGWWRYHYLQSAEEFAMYCRRVKRASARIGGRALAATKGRKRARRAA